MFKTKEEIWRDIPRYLEKYKASNLGNIYSIKNNQKLKTNISQNGYERLNLYSDGKRIKEYVHRLVAEAFLENKDNKEFVNHIDENKLNNNINNLEWTTNSENQLHGTCISKIQKALSFPVVKISITNEIIEEYSSIKDAALSIKDNASTSSISKACKGILKTAYGFKWKYKNN